MAAPNNPEALQSAIELHRAGRLAEAEVIYRQILDHQPDHGDARHLLGVAALMLGRREEAAEFIARALQIVPEHPIYLANLGETYRQLERLDDAIVVLREATTIKPDYPEAWNTLGSALAQMKGFQEAILCFQRATTLRPDFADAHTNLGRAWIKLERWPEATTCFRRAAELQPTSADAQNRLANALLRIEQWDEAIASGQRALELKPGAMEPYGNLAVAFMGKDQCEEAIQWGEKALAVQPGCAETLSNLGAASLRLGRNTEAFHFLEQAVAADPDFAPAHWNYSQILLLLGRYAEGWREYEWRWQAPPLSAFRRPFTAPAWDGYPARDKTLLVHTEQGYGDTLQFVRYLPQLQSQSEARRVLFECPASMVTLFQTQPGIQAEVIARRSWDGATLPQFDVQVALHSLPHLLGLPEPNAIAGPYLSADPNRRATWRQRLEATAGRRVGLMWSGNRHPQWHHRRSIPEDVIRPLLALPGVRFHHLQVEPPDNAPTTLRNAGLIDFTPDLKDFAETAAFIAELDLIISIDTAVLHLAGALGRPTWALLPAVADWRWGLEAETTPWYPTMRLFRQPKRGDWESVIQRVTEALIRTGCPQ